MMFYANVLIFNSDGTKVLLQSDDNNECYDGIIVELNDYDTHVHNRIIDKVEMWTKVRFDIRRYKEIGTLEIPYNSTKTVFIGLSLCNEDFVQKPEWSKRELRWFYIGELSKFKLKDGIGYFIDIGKKIMLDEMLSGIDAEHFDSNKCATLYPKSNNCVLLDGVNW